MKKKPKFVIVTFRQGRGGTIVLHALQKYLTELGFNAKVLIIGFLPQDMFSYTNYLKFLYNDTKNIIKSKFLGKKAFNIPKYQEYVNVPIKKFKRKLLPFVGKNTVVVYPEVMKGNFLNAKNVVRWLLSFSDFKPGEYDENDLFVCYRKIFNDSKLNPNEYTLCTPFMDFDLYKQTNFGERKGKCYIIRKGASRPDIPKDFDGVIIDDLLEKDKVKVFNECEYCISYDSQTAYNSIAAICGCIPIIVTEKGKTRSDYLKDDDKNYGIAYGFSEDEINYAKSTLKLAKKDYEDLMIKAKEETKNFVEICKKHFFGEDGK